MFQKQYVSQDKKTDMYKKQYEHTSTYERDMSQTQNRYTIPQGMERGKGVDQRHKFNPKPNPSSCEIHIFLMSYSFSLTLTL